MPAALERAKTHLSESFKLQQQLDDEIPDTIEEQRSWLGDIIARSEEANAALDAEKASFDELRELERTAPQVLASIRTQHAEAQTSLAAAESKLAALTQQYSDTAVEPVRDNAAQARERLDFVVTAAAEADAKLAAGEKISSTEKPFCLNSMIKSIILFTKPIFTFLALKVTSSLDIKSKALKVSILLALVFSFLFFNPPTFVNTILLNVEKLTTLILKLGSLFSSSSNFSLSLFSIS